MEYIPEPNERVLAIDPMAFGFGFVVLEMAPTRLVSWGTKPSRRDDGSCLLALNQLLFDYQPTAIVMPDWREVQHEFRGPALEAFVEAVGEALNSPVLPVLLCSPEEVRQRFSTVARTKHEIAVHLAATFPELRTILPRKRRSHDRESVSMSVFDALAMALSAFPPPTN